jgi:predicted permease
LLLLITCVNVGNLVLLRTTMREAEIVVRRSLGASTADIMRPLLWEGAALGLIGGFLGTAISGMLLGLLTGLDLPQMPRLDLLRGGMGRLAMAGTVTLTALLIAGLIPTLAILRGRLGQTVRSDARAGRGSVARRRMRQWLVSVQVALALIMLTAAALLVRSLNRLNHVPLGYESRHLAILSMAHTVSFDSIDVQMAAMYDRLEPVLLAVPGVTRLTPIAVSPFYGPHIFTTRLAAEGQSEEESRASPMTPFEVGGAEYFQTFGIPVLRGRGFLESDRADAPRVMVVSHAVAQRFWPGENPVGKRLRMVGDTGANVWITVVGEAGDIRYRNLRQATSSAYFPWRQLFFQGTVAIRTSVPLETVLPEIRRAVRAADGAVTITRAEAMDDLVAEQLAVPRLSTRLLSAFGLAALLLAAIGLYGVMAASVRERTRELGIRAALGATPGRLRLEVLTQAGIIAAAGATVGLIAALATSRFLQSLLFEVKPLDPAAILGACGTLMLVALAAAYFPAWLATRADPATALRAE